MTLEITLTESELEKAQTLAREWAQGAGYTGASFERVVCNFIEGYQEGREEETKKIALRMLQKNMDMSLIMKLTGCQ